MTQMPVGKKVVEPTLQPPGAGLPLLEAFILRYWVYPRATRKMTWDQCSVYFDRQCQRILDVIRPLENSPQLDERVLVPRLKGLEDSSRFWSISMTLDHLVIVSHLMREVIIALGQEHTPSIVADVASVKPRGSNASSQVLVSFKSMAESLTKSLNTTVTNRKSKTKHVHPWFGAINNHGWHWVMATHIGLHRRQIEFIFESLLRQNPSPTLKR